MCDVPIEDLGTEYWETLTLHVPSQLSWKEIDVGVDESIYVQWTLFNVGVEKAWQMNYKNCLTYVNCSKLILGTRALTQDTFYKIWKQVSSQELGSHKFGLQVLDKIFQITQGT